MNAIQKSTVFFVLAFACGVAAQAAPVIGNPEAPVGGTFYQNLDVEPTGLNPLRGTDGVSATVMGYAFDTLLSRNVETFEWEPALAEKWDISKDGMTMTFVIRDGATFHDGTPVTIEDVKFSFDANLDEKLADAGKKMYFESIEKAEIVDKKTIRFHVKQKYFKNLDFVGGNMAILPKAIYGDATKKVSKIMMGSGPYKLEKYDQGKSITLKRNEKWWGFHILANRGYYKFDKLNFRFIKDRTAQLETLKKGDLDYYALDPEQYEKNTAGPMWDKTVFKKAVENSAPQKTAFIAFNLRRPIFKDREVRHALSQLYNREFAVEKFFFGKYLAATGPWFQQSPDADPNTKAVKYDFAGAKAKFKKAGWEDTDKDGILDKMIDGKKTDFRFTIMHGGGPWEKYLTVFKEDLKKAGIEIELKQLEWSAFNKAITDFNFDMVCMAWGGVIDGDPKQIWHSSSISKQGSNFAGYSNPEVDKMIDAARLELDYDKRLKMKRKIFAQIAADHPYIFLYNPKFTYYAHTARMGMVKPTYKYDIVKEAWWIKAD